MLGIDQIVGGIGEEGLASIGAGPLSCRIGGRDEFGANFAGGADCGIIERRQIFLDRACGVFGDGPAIPILAGKRPLLVRIRGDQAGIAGKALSAAGMPITRWISWTSAACSIGLDA
jgi:hypothetical protein